jgi:type IV pilus assembly protein PilO
VNKLLEQFKGVDWQDPGRWPLVVRASIAGLCFIVLTGVLFYLFVLRDRQPELEQLQQTEASLRAEMRDKHSKAVNLNLYKTQLSEIENSFGAMLRQLPSKTEVPSLLVDISQTALSAALEQKLFEPHEEVKKDFYAEKPIKLRFTGSYHQFGAFVAGIAALGRIVTLHDVEIVPVSGSTGYDKLQMDLTAKTYRYLDDDEVKAAEDVKRKATQAEAAAGAAAKGGA